MLTGQSLVSKAVGIGVLLVSLIGYPLLAVLTGKPWLAAQVFGIAPDPTATATLGFLTMCHGPGVQAALIRAIRRAAVLSSDKIKAASDSLHCIAIRTAICPSVARGSE